MKHRQPSTRLDQASIDAIRKMRKFNWKKTWSFWYKTDHVTRKKIKPFSVLYKGHRYLDSPTGHIFLVRYLTPESYMFEKLKGNVE